MSDYRKLAHLEEQIGRERFEALLDPKNTGKVMTLADDLITEGLPTEMTLGGIPFDVLPLPKVIKRTPGNPVLIDAARQLSASAGEKDGEHFRRHQSEVPAIFAGKVTFVFPEWPCRGDEGCAYFRSVNDGGGHSSWHLSWNQYDRKPGSRYRVLRRK